MQIQSILGKLPVAPVGDTGTFPYVQPLSQGAWQQQAGFLQWMQDVVVNWRKVPCEHAKAPFGGHSLLLALNLSEGSMPILVSSSSSAAVGAGACSRHLLAGKKLLV